MEAHCPSEETKGGAGVSDILKDLMIDKAPVAAPILPDAAIKDPDSNKKPVASLIANIPTPGRRRSPATAPASSQQRGPTPWEIGADGAQQSHGGPSYRDQLRVSGQQALQRAWEGGLLPKNSNSAVARFPPAGAVPLNLSSFAGLGAHAPVGSPMGSPMGSPVATPVNNPMANPMVTPMCAPVCGPMTAPMAMPVGCGQAAMSPMAGCMPQMMYMQQDPQAAQMMPYHAVSTMIPAPMPNDNVCQMPVPPVPQHFSELNNEQIAEILCHASDEVYAD
jgi:hypothetical protein